jgi:hypothetical protein
MAEKPKSVQEKVTIRPTPVGARVIQRLGIPHMDKSGELRRLLELGFAAELAGFSLDGNVLRHGGRVWDLRSDLEQSEAGEHGSRTSPQPPASLASEAAGTGTDPKSVPAAAVEKQQTTLPEADGAVELAAHQDSPLRANLRGLSGGS